MSMSVSFFFLRSFKIKAVIRQLPFSRYFKCKQPGKQSIILSLCILPKGKQLDVIIYFQKKIAPCHKLFDGLVCACSDFQTDGWMSSWRDDLSNCIWQELFICHKWFSLLSKTRLGIYQCFVWLQTLFSWENILLRCFQSSDLTLPWCKLI